MSAPRDGNDVRMTDAELEHIFDLPPGHLAKQPAEALGVMEAVREASTRLVAERVRELLEGRERAARAAGLMAFAESASPAPLLPYQRALLAVIASGAPVPPHPPRLSGKSRLAAEIERLRGGRQAVDGEPYAG